MKIFFLSSFIILLSLHESHAQNDTAISLKEVEISSARLLFNSGIRNQEFDSTVVVAYSHSSLSDLLTHNSSIYLKTYGSGGLSTPTLRGGNAYQTAILWNGFSIASPTHGLTDLSLERNFFFDDISVQYGGTSSLWGSGAVSGNILLTNKPSFEKGFSVSAGIDAGSFSNFSQHAGISWSNTKFSTSLKVFNLNSENNFLYKDESTETEKEQTHARIKQYGLMNDNYVSLGRYSLLNFRIWYSFSDREIPPTTQQANSGANQKDINARFSAEWKYAPGKNEIAVRSAYFHETLNYNDQFLSQPSDNKSKNFINELTYSRTLSQFLVQAGISHTYSSADSTNNLVDASVSRLALFALGRYKSKNEKLELSASGRKEFSDLQSSPLVFSGGLNYFLLKKLLYRFSASQVYRNPTLNDLFWNPGGNPDLEAEKGYSIETGLQLNVSDVMQWLDKRSSSSVMIHATAYYKTINDWIIWYPSASFIWRPMNLLEVKSQGLELGMGYRYSEKKFSAGIDFDFSYTQSTNEKSIYPNDASVHQQLIYVPKYRWNGRLFFGYGDFRINYNHSYTGYRYTSSDNLSWLDPYHIDNLRIEKLFRFPHMRLNLFAGVNNIFDTSYETVESRPMPLRNYSAGLTVSYNQKK